METLLATLALCLGAALAVGAIDPGPRCMACKARTEADEGRLTGRVPPVVMLTYRCPRCVRIAFHRAMVVWD